MRTRPGRRSDARDRATAHASSASSSSSSRCRRTISTACVLFAIAATLPIIADESCLVATDVAKLVGVVDGVNLKLAKCGSLREALRMIHTARAHGMLVMAGCMIETSLGITAAAHLGSVARCGRSGRRRAACATIHSWAPPSSTASCRCPPRPDSACRDGNPRPVVTFHRDHPARRRRASRRRSARVRLLGAE